MRAIRCGSSLRCHSSLPLLASSAYTVALSSPMNATGPPGSAAIVTAVRAEAWASKVQYVQPLVASSAYTRPVALVTYRRPPTIVGWP